MTYSEAIKKRILDLCRENKITVNKLSTLSGLRQSTVDHIVRGDTQSPGLKTLHCIAQGFGMKLCDFLDFPEINEGILDDEADNE